MTIDDNLWSEVVATLHVAKEALATIRGDYHFDGEDSVWGVTLDEKQCDDAYSIVAGLLDKLPGKERQ